VIRSAIYRVVKKSGQEESDLICEPWLPCLPQIGEFISIGDKHYEVKNIVMNIYKGNFDDVHIFVE